MIDVLIKSKEACISKEVYTLKIKDNKEFHW